MNKATGSAKDLPKPVHHEISHVPMILKWLEIVIKYQDKLLLQKASSTICKARGMEISLYKTIQLRHMKGAKWELNVELDQQ